MENRKRQNRIAFYLNDDEYTIMRAKMKMSGSKSVSSYFRQFIRYGLVYEVDYAPIRNMNMQLGKIGSNVNQIAKRANETHRIYKEDIEEIKEKMEQIWRLQKYILSKQPWIER